jgi:c(7)-type cytochrome triheme protein
MKQNTVNTMKKVFLLFLFFSAVMLAVSAEQVFSEDEAPEHGGDIIYTKPLKAVIFSHKAHTEDIGLQCEWCHDSTFEMEALHMQETANFDMQSLCNENYCGTCHNGDISFSTTVQCARCHIGVKGYNELVQQGKIHPDIETSVPTPKVKKH